MSEGTTSEWCYNQRDKALQENRQEDAEHYLNLAVLWKEREMKSNV